MASGIDTLNLKSFTASSNTFNSRDLNNNGKADALGIHLANVTNIKNNIIIEHYFGDTTVLTPGVGLIEDILFSGKLNANFNYVESHLVA